MNSKKDKIIIKGARENNLKNIDISLPRNKFIVFTGLSGSGKSSLAFDTIYAEGQRRYVESLSSYARQFLGQMDKPNVEYIEGLSPAISIDQKTTSHNPRSTVGTVTEIYDYLRLLYANIGIAHCPVCKKEIKSMTIQEIVDKIMEFPEGSRLQLISPVVRSKKGRHEKVLQAIKKEGFVRIRINGEIKDISDEIDLDKNKKNSIDVVVDRIVIKSNIEKRLADSIEIAVKMSDGLVSVDTMDGNEKLFSTNFSCPDHEVTIEEISPRMFSFNAPYGACETCNGLGYMNRVDAKLVVPDPSRSLSEGAVEAWNSSDKNGNEGYYMMMIRTLAQNNKVSMDIPFEQLPKDFVQKLLYGSDELLTFKFESQFADGVRTYNAKFEGVIPNLERRLRETSSDYVREKLNKYVIESKCPSCNGHRLKKEVLSITVGGKNISEMTDMSVSKLLDFVNSLELTEKEKFISEEILKEVRNRLTFLLDVGLEYLTLSRKASTLSGGESQRIRLATQIGSALVGVLYVLDEPSIGLHQKDNDRLIKTLRNLTDIGNTLIVVEHDEDTMYAADEIVDIGPGAGIHGGEIIAQGSINVIKKCKHSITGQYLSGKKYISLPDKRRTVTEDHHLHIRGARENNLKDIDVSIPLSVMNVVTGVSGSGKSSLINQILYKAVAAKINRTKEKPGEFTSIEGMEQIDKVVNIDQSPIGRTPRSNPATYTGVFDFIRDIFAETLEAKARGYKKGRFSFNVKGGRCEACNGDGIIKIEMHFLPDVYVPCEVCKAKRYNRETLQILYKGKSISDVLEMNVEEAYSFFENIPKIKKKLETLLEVGLGYIKLGQPSTELSGGEAQRIKLAAELSKKGTGNTLYILDEPTTGLHIADVDKLIHVLQKLVDNGNTVVVIEHNLDVIKIADNIIDLGPDGGDKGGEIIFTGTPEEILKCKRSYTGQYLKKHLKR
ncbi:excinuclease ABC subunit UvrA [Filifactor villosus]|uniref:UvrABC system protein A n=1 Tax=Filifactor villosus TaxID=29374 RepID=A0ABV9QLS6_9FIRM